MTSEDAEHHYETGWGWLGIKGLYREYMWVWIALFVLTVVEVYVPEPHIFAELYESLGLTFLVGPQEWINAWYMEYLGNSRPFVVISLIVMALMKTWLVAWYYMHLISEKPSIVLVACAPFVFSLFLTIGLFPWGTAFGIPTDLFVP